MKQKGRIYMSKSKDETLSEEAKAYQQFQKIKETKRPVVKNCLKAFFIGGFICLIGQVISMFYVHFFDFTEKTASNPTIATLIFITMLRSEEHTSELQSRGHLVCRLLLEKKKIKKYEL